MQTRPPEATDLLHPSILRAARGDRLHSDAATSGGQGTRFTPNRKPELVAPQPGFLVHHTTPPFYLPSGRRPQGHRRERRPPRYAHRLPKPHTRTAAMSAADAPNLIERTTEPPSHFRDCMQLYSFLTALGVDRKDTWAKDSMASPCCGFDASDDVVHRQLVCDHATGAFKALYWGPNELVGDIRTNSLSKVSESWEVIDFAGNSRLTGEFPGWMFQLKGLRNLNLSSTSISGPLPRLMTALPQLSTLDVSRTKMSGAVPAAVPATCDLEGSDACVTSEARCGVEAACPPGTFVAPEVPASTGKPGATGPSYGGAIPIPPAAQCKVLKTWLVAHGAKESELWSDAGSACCPSWRPAIMDYTKPLTKEISCAPDWGIQKVLFRDSGLTGDINAGSDALKQLAALREFQVSGNAGLTGTFPAFLAEMPDLFGFGLANTSLEGPIPDLRGLPNLASIDVTGAKFSGPLPPLKREIQGLAYTGPSYSTCRLASSDSGLCWQYDRSAYDPVCLDSNPAVRSCAAPAAFTVGPLQPSGTSSAASTSAPAAEPSSVNVGAIVGGVIGGLVLLALLAFLGYRLFRKPAPAAPAPAPAPEEPKPEAKPEMLAAPEEKPRRMSFRDRRMSVDTLATAHSVSNADVVMTPTAAMSRQA